MFYFKRHRSGQRLRYDPSIYFFSEVGTGRSSMINNPHSNPRFEFYKKKTILMVL